MEVAFTDQNFEREVLRADILVLVDFWASWCEPCRRISPVVSALAEEFQGKIKIGKLNVDKNPITAQRYGVMSIPTLIFFRKGTIVGQFMGVQSKEILAARIDQLLALEVPSRKRED